jgi:hypothetical protein
MTIAVACTIADEVIMGGDSAVTLQDATGAPQRIYADGEKLFYALVETHCRRHVAASSDPRPHDRKLDQRV